jgi:PAS domain S-box-containing protein/putative nucleotidyltransferase with HDIG domain
MVDQSSPGIQSEFSGLDHGKSDSSRFGRAGDKFALPSTWHLDTAKPIFLSENNSILSLLIKNLPGMAYRSRHNGNWIIDYVSEGCFQLTGYRPGDLVQNKQVSYIDLVHPEDRQYMVDSMDTALKDRKPFDIVYRIVSQTGDQKWVRDLGHGEYLVEEDLATVEGFIIDITDRKQSEKRIQCQLERFEALRKVDLAISSSLDLRLTLDILLDQVTRHLNVDSADILLVNPASQAFEFMAGRGFRTTALQHTNLRLGEGYAGLAALERQIIRVSNLSASLGDFKRAPQLTDEGFVEYLGVPLIAKGQVLGILEIFHRRHIEVDEEWMNFLESLASHAAIAVDNATMYNNSQRSNIELTMAYDDTLEGWSKALELRDQGTEGHNQRVAAMTLRLAKSLEIKTDDLLHIRRGALLHDIGKMGIPDHILLKPGPLNSEEWAIMRNHPEYAYNLLSSISYLKPSLDIPYCHHEKWDGTGYPCGLKGEQIPIFARMFAVVDVWDALLSDRPYRPAWNEDQVFSFIREQSGKHFDPLMVEAFMKLF